MKKLIALSFATLLIGCVNPSLRDGLNSLDIALADLAEAIENLNIPQMQADLESMNAMAEDMIVSAEEAQGALETALDDISNIEVMLEEAYEISLTLATTEQMSALASQTAEFAADVETLVLAADYDHDGVINAMDKCPDTKLGLTVDSDGCAAGQTSTTID